jgi:acyl carrier protein
MVELIIWIEDRFNIDINDEEADDLEKGSFSQFFQFLKEKI